MDEQTRASRARFLGTAGVAGAALAAGAWKTSKAGAAAAPGRTYSAGHFALELDGAKEATFLRSVDGGNARGEVVREVGSAGYYQKKHIGNVKYEDFTAELGISMSKAVYQWIAATLTGNRDHERKSGAVVAADFNYSIQSTREFTDALITEVGFPALDAGSKDAAFITLKFAPTQTVDRPRSGQLSGGTKQQQKQWTPANFRVDIKDLPTGKISKVDAITIKQTTVTGDIGETRDYELEPGKLEIPNLAFTLAETDAQPWYDWFKSFVLEGNNGDEREKTAQIVYLAADLKTELGRLDLFNLGIFKLAPAKAEAASEQIRRVKAELYCERIEFVLPGVTA